MGTGRLGGALPGHVLSADHRVGRWLAGFWAAPEAWTGGPGRNAREKPRRPDGLRGLLHPGYGGEVPGAGGALDRGRLLHSPQGREIHLRPPS